jgi:hypothetical protein
MPRSRALPPNAEIAVRANVEPILLKGGGTVKSLSAHFLADLERDWRQHGQEVLDVLRERYPNVYFNGVVALARVIRWELGPPGAFERPTTPEAIATGHLSQAGGGIRCLHHPDGAWRRAGRSRFDRRPDIRGPGIVPFLQAAAIVV